MPKKPISEWPRLERRTAQSLISKRSGLKRTTLHRATYKKATSEELTPKGCCRFATRGAIDLLVDDGMVGLGASSQGVGRQNVPGTGLRFCDKTGIRESYVTLFLTPSKG